MHYPIHITLMLGQAAGGLPLSVEVDGEVAGGHPRLR